MRNEKNENTIFININAIIRYIIVTSQKEIMRLWQTIGCISKKVFVITSCSVVWYQIWK